MMEPTIAKIITFRPVKVILGNSNLGS